MLRNEKTPIGVRIALLSELERRKLGEGPPYWVKLLRNTRDADRIAVVRAVAARIGDSSWVLGTSEKWNSVSYPVGGILG